MLPFSIQDEPSRTGFCGHHSALGQELLPGAAVQAAGCTLAVVRGGRRACKVRYLSQKFLIPIRNNDGLNQLLHFIVPLEIEEMTVIRMFGSPPRNSSGSETSDTGLMHRISANFLANESLAAKSGISATPAQAPAATPRDTSFLQTGGPAAKEPPGSVATAMADAAQLSNSVAASVAEPLTSRVADLRPGVLNLTAVHDDLPGDAAAVSGNAAAVSGSAAGKAINVTRDIKQDALAQLALVFGPGRGSTGADAQPLAAGALVPAAAPILAPAGAAPVLVPAAAAPRMAPASAPLLPDSDLAVAAALLSSFTPSAFSSTADQSSRFQSLSAARSPAARPAAAGSAISLQATSPQSAAMADAAASLDAQSKQGAEVDAKIASNWQAILSNWSLLGRAGLAAPENTPRRRSLLDGLVPLTSAPAAPTPLTHRLQTGLLARICGTFSGLLRPAGAGGKHAIEKPVRRGLAASATLGAFPPAAVIAAAAPAPATAPADAQALAILSAVSKALRADGPVLQSLALDPEQLQLLQSVVLEQPTQEGAADASALVSALSVNDGGQPGPGFSLQQVC